MSIYSIGRAESHVLYAIGYNMRLITHWNTLAMQVIAVCNVWRGQKLLMYAHVRRIQPVQNSLSKKSKICARHIVLRIPWTTPAAVCATLMSWSDNPHVCNDVVEAHCYSVRPTLVRSYNVLCACTVAETCSYFECISYSPSTVPKIWLTWCGWTAWEVSNNIQWW